MYILDTNTIRYAFYEPDNYPQVVANINAHNHLDLWISIVTAYELIKWRYNPLLRANNQQPPYVLRAYHNFFEIISDICSLQIKPYDAAAQSNFTKMPGNVGIQDSRIAATALAWDFTVVSNDRHFRTIKSRKPSLKLINWVTTPPSF